MSNQVTKHKSRRFRRFAKANEAVSALEYAILVGVVAVAIGTALVAFGGKIGTALTAIGGKVGAVTSSSIPTTTPPASF